jgi:hypothetical protein
MATPEFFTVVGDFKPVVVDLPTDPDADPQLGSLSATVTFTPMINDGDVILATDADPRPTGFIAAPIVAKIDTDGILKLRVDPDGIRTNAANVAAFPGTGSITRVYFAQDTSKFYRWNGSGYAETYSYTPVRLLANTPLLELDGPLYYKVTFTNVVYNRRPGLINSFTFEAPTNDDQVLNLIEVFRQPGVLAGGITKIAPGGVRIVDGKLQFSFGGVDIPDAVDINIDTTAISDSGAFGRDVVTTDTTADFWDIAGTVPSGNLPSYVDDVVEYANLAAFPVTGESGKIYLDISTTPATSYRWTGSAYAKIGGDVTAENISNSTALGRSLVKASSKEVARTAIEALPVFDARNWGVSSDVTGARLVANLRDVIAACSAAGGGVVELPSGLLDTTGVALGATVTADSGATYLNVGGLPIPDTVDLTVTGQGPKTKLKLSPGFLRFLDFAPATAGTAFGNIAVRNLTIERTVVGTDIGPMAQVSSTVTAGANAWVSVTTTGATLSQWSNATYAWAKNTNQIFGMRNLNGVMQLQDLTGAGSTIVAGTQLVGHVYDSVIGNRIINHAYPTRSSDYTVKSVVIEDVDSSLPAATLPSGVNIGSYIGDSGCHLEMLPNPLNAVTTPTIGRFIARRWRMTGGAGGIVVNTALPKNTTWMASPRQPFLDDAVVERVSWDSLIDQTANWTSAGVQFSLRSRRIRTIDIKIERSGDVGLEIDQCWDFEDLNPTYRNNFSDVFRTNYAVPARQASGPVTTTLNNGSTLGSGDTTCTITSLPIDIEVQRSGMVLIDSELLWYRATSEDGRTWQLWRGLNASTAASHAADATVVFIPITGQRFVSRNLNAVRQHNTSVIGQTYYGFCANTLPMPPLMIRDAKIQVSGSNPTGSMPTAIYQRGLCFDTDIEGMRYSVDGFTNAALTLPPWGIQIEELVPGQNRVRDLATNGVPVPAPRLYIRNSILRHSGGMYSGVAVALSVNGFYKFDVELEYDVTQTNPNGNRAIAVSLQSALTVAAGSRFAIKMRSTSDKSSSSSSTQSHTALSVNTSTTLPSTGMDVDLIDVSDLAYGTNSSDSLYAPYTIANSAHIGMVRFHRIHHPTGLNQAAYAARKLPNRYITSASSPFAVTPWTEIVYCDTSSGPVTITLPKTTGGASTLGEPLQRGRVPLRIIDAARTAQTNAITITPASTDKIDGGSAGASITLTTAGAPKTLIAQPGLPGWLSADASSSSGGASHGYQSTHYYFPNSQQATSTSAALGYGTLRVTPFTVNSAVTISKLHAEYTVAGDAASVIRMGIWQDNGSGQPGVLIVEAATTPSTGGTPGSVEANASATLSPGTVYYIGGVVQGSGTQPTVRTVSAGAMPDVVQITQGASLPAAGSVAVAFNQAAVTGALPNPFGTANPTAAAPRVGFRVA